MNEPKYTKWVACWGNATSISNRTECTYAKDLTLRYPIRMCFSGCALRLRFSNLTGTEPITISRVTVARAVSDKVIDVETLRTASFCGEASAQIAPGAELETDELPFRVTAGETLSVSIWLKDFTQMNSGVLITGPLSKGFFAYGDHACAAELPLDLTRSTKWFWFLNTIDILTEEKNHALVCYGDSITAQSWPDLLAQRCAENGWNNVSIIRRAVSGTRILREYDCITYAAYGLKGEKRFVPEMNVAGADAVIIQHGINDIIHPVGVETNVFRPWSDLPAPEDMIEGVRRLYVEPARRMGLKVWGGTLLPIEGWRTYAPFRNDIRNAYNEWLRTSDELDGCVDFDAATYDAENPAAFSSECDSGDHLHPSEYGYQQMANAVPESLLNY